jgi:transposase
VTVLEILRLTEMGYSQRKIGGSVKCSKSTVGEIQRRCREIGLNYSQAAKLSDKAIKSLVYPVYTSRKVIKPDPDYESIQNALKQDSNKNLQYLWEDYRSDNPEGLSYSQFCERFRRWKADNGQNVNMHIEREPGKEMLIDWMGDTLEIVFDSITGQVFKAYFFVTTLGYSGYPYAEAFPNQKQESWQQGHVNALNYYGGTSLIFVPDNLLTGVTKASHYEPVINQAYWELAKHYNVAVIPARVRKPQDKAVVETSIGWLETWLLSWLKGQKFFSFAELNKAIRQRLAELIERPFQKRPGSRLSNFIEFDQPCLRPLPFKDFEIADMITKRLPDNYHVEYQGYYYSAPFGYFNQMVTIRATQKTIEIFDVNRIRIASHQRSFSKRYVTDTAHMPEKHRRWLEAKQFDGYRYRCWAKNIGPETAHVIDRMLRSCKVEEQSYKACMGLLQLSKKFGDKRLEAACKKAIGLNSMTYTTVSNILKHGQDLAVLKLKSAATPEHGNIRGAAYYS